MNCPSCGHENPDSARFCNECASPFSGTCPTCWGELVGVGTAKIYGAMVVGNDVDAAGAFSGSADIYYSCEGVAKAVEVFNQTFRTVGWNEED